MAAGLPNIEVFDSANYALTPYALTPFLVGVLIAGLGIAVLIRERVSLVSAAFCLMTWVGAVWLMSYMGIYSALSESLALWWVKVENVAVVSIPSTLYLFSLAVVGQLRRDRVFALGSCLLSGLFCLAILKTDQFISGLYLYPWGHYARYGILSIPFLIFFGAVLITTLRLFWAEYRQAQTEQQRRRMKSLVVAFSIAYLGSVDYLAAYGIPFYPVGYLPVFAFIILVAQAIWQYRLVEITPAFAAEQIISTMADALLVIDHEGTVRVANQAADRLFGDHKTGLVGKNIAALNNGFFVKNKLHVLLRKGGLERYETTYHASEGRVAHLDVAATPILDKTGQPIGAVCIMRDINERKRAEQLLRESQLYAESIVDTVREPLVVLDTWLRVKSANRAFYQTFQLSPKETVNRPIYELGPSPWNISKMRALLEILPKETPFENVELDYEFPNIGRRTLLLNARRLYREGNHTEMILLAMEDITQRKEWERQLVQQSQKIRQAHEELKKSHEEIKSAQLQLIQAAKIESVGRLAAGVAHEVKNPLAVILQGVDYLSKNLPAHNSGDVETVISYTRDAVRRADAVIRGVLDFSVAKELELHPDDLNAVVEQSLLLVKHELDKHHITLVTELGQGLPQVRLDRNKIEQVFVNLFMNAIQAMLDGGTLSIKTFRRQIDPSEIRYKVGDRNGGRFMTRESAVVAEVEDTGTGIPEEILSKIFDPFFTTKPTGKGTGLGLTVTKNIMELHGGEIDIRNRQGTGVKATLMFRTTGGSTHG